MSEPLRLMPPVSLTGGRPIAVDLEAVCRALCAIDCQDPDRQLDGASIWSLYAQEADRAVRAVSAAAGPAQPDLFGRLT